MSVYEEHVTFAKERGRLARLDYFMTFAMRHSCQYHEAVHFATDAERLFENGVSLSVGGMFNLLSVTVSRSARK